MYSNYEKTYLHTYICGNHIILPTSIIKELELRTYSPYKNPNNPKLIYKHAEEMSSEERKRLKGDTINLDMLAKKNISTNIAEAIMQIQQDICINKKQFIQMARLDSIFKKRLYVIENSFCVLFGCQLSNI